MVEWMEKHRAVTATVALLAIALAACAIIMTFRSRDTPVTGWAKVWCYDLGADKVILGSEALAPPFVAPSGALVDGSPSGVRAEVYSCGSCDIESQRFVAWLWKFKPEVRDRVQALIDAQPQGYREVNPYIEQGAWGDLDGRLLASPADTDTWYAESSEEGQNLAKELAHHCPEGSSPKPCPAK